MLWHGGLNNIFFLLLFVSRFWPGTKKMVPETSAKQAKGIGDSSTEKEKSMD